MRAVVALCLAVLLVMGAVASVEELVEYVVDVKVRGEEDIVTLTKRGFSLEHARVGSPSVEAYATQEGLDLLRALGFEYDARPNEIQHMVREKRGVSAQYHNYDRLTAFMNEMATTYSNFTRVFSLGKSIQGREMWAIEISANPGVNEIEPEFKYIANMHGDEVVGREMSINLIELLCTEYNKDSGDLSTRITNLINSVDIYIVPSMNPDGFERGTRGNALYKDLNRDFPDQFTSPHNDKVGRQVEVQHVMDFANAHHFVLSANFHGGTVVANYPWDGNRNYRSGAYSACPDDAVFKRLATLYSTTHTTMHSSWEFSGGITNGADWYVLYGGMQDWGYLYNGEVQLTLEISDDKYPSPATLPSFWVQNKDAMLAYMEQVNVMGVRGVVTDAASGAPLAARINVVEINHPVSADPAHGDYYRLLTAGHYTLSVSAEGYTPQTAEVDVPENQTQQVVLNFQLEKK